MNLTRIKQSLAHASQTELDEISKWVKQRVTQVRDLEHRKDMNDAWERIKHLKVGDTLYAHNRGSSFWKCELVIYSGPRPRARDVWIVKPPKINGGSGTQDGRFMKHDGKDIVYLKTSMILAHDLRPDPCPAAVLEILKGPDTTPSPF
jgi:hypothetical protein